MVSQRFEYAYVMGVALILHTYCCTSVVLFKYREIAFNITSKLKNASMFVELQHTNYK